MNRDRGICCANRENSRALRPIHPDARQPRHRGSTFTEERVFGYGDRGIVGRANIAADGHVHKPLASRHLNTSLLFDIGPSGDRATGTSTTNGREGHAGLPKTM